MGSIGEKFKDNSPQNTVKNIKKILEDVGITLTEHWFDSGISNCYSLHVSAEGGFPGTNGKGATEDLARASGYAEFIERLQSGLLFYKYQSFERDPDVFLHTYAPDGKYMSRKELIENGEWMDYIIDTYGGRLTREELAEQCAMYASADEVLTLPFYSLFEDKYVYLPAHFVEHMFCANGVCVGNTREEAWIHGLSEMLEREAATRMIMSGEAVPSVPEEILNRSETIRETIARLKKNNQDVTVLDMSFGSGFPVLATRIIDKNTGSYIINFGADPVFELAVERTLTEVMQGKSIESIQKHGTTGVLKNIAEVNSRYNLLNQLETGNGQFTVDFFTQELSASRKFEAFADNSGKNNKELLREMLQRFKAMGKPLYVRNYSFLGFPCYMLAVPGLSEARSARLNDFLQEYAFGDSVYQTLRYVEKADDAALEELLLFHQFIFGARSRRYNYSFLAGLPFSDVRNASLLTVHMAYAAYRLGRFKVVDGYLGQAIGFLEDGAEKNYLACVKQYFALKQDGLDEEKILLLLRKFYLPQSFEKLVSAIPTGEFFAGLLVRCDMQSCATCAYREKCRFDYTREFIGRVGKIYSEYTNGQAKENFAVEF